MKGKKIPPEVAEEVKALSLVYSPKAISKKINLGLRTVYNILARKDSLVTLIANALFQMKLVKEVSLS